MRGLEQLSVTWSMAHTRTSVARTNHQETVLVSDEDTRKELCIDNYTFSYDLFGHEVVNAWY